MLREKMIAVITELNDFIAERTELIKCIAYALLTSMNLFILGDTGQAKSYAINEFRKRIIGAAQFECLLSKQTEAEAIFGRIDLSTMIPGNVHKEILENDSCYQTLLCQLQELALNNPDDIDNQDTILKKLENRKRALSMLYGNKTRINTAGYIPEAHIVFLDEIFKCNEGTLNAMLTVLNERKFTNEGEATDILAISFMSASNEIPNFNNPEDQILRPLYDRFEIKLITHYIQSRDARLRILSHKQNGISKQCTTFITLEELCSMQYEVASVTVPDEINEIMDDILCELRVLGIHVSDRKFLKYHPLAQANAWLNGRDTITIADLSVMKHYLWTTPDDIPIIQQVLDKFCTSQLQEEIKEIISMANESYNDFSSNVDTDAIKAMNKFRGELKRLFDRLNEMMTGLFDTEDRDAVAATIDELEELNLDAHHKCRFTYAPLSKLYKF